MTDTPTIAVRGEATLDVDAEVAEFTASVEVHEAERVAALERVAERVAAVRAALDQFRDVIERHATSHVSASAEKHHHTGEVSFHGNATTIVVMSDLDAVGNVMLAVGSLAEVSVWGPSWSVRPASPVHREVRHAAISDAIARARDYAAALGADIVGLVELSDAGLSRSGEPRAVPLAMAASAARSPRLDLDPQRLQVRASIEARFTISEPTILAAPID
jgi:uncharacterized protein